MEHSQGGLGVALSIQSKDQRVGLGYENVVHSRDRLRVDGLSHAQEELQVGWGMQRHLKSHWQSKSLIHTA